MRLFLRRALIVTGLFVGALILWSLVNTLVFAVVNQSQEVKYHYGWIP